MAEEVTHADDTSTQEQSVDTEPKTFTQEEVNAINAKERRSRKAAEERLSAIEAELAAAREQAAEVEALKQKLEDAGKSAEERAKAEQERAQQRIAKQLEAAAKERDEYKRSAEQALERVRETDLRYQVNAALQKAKVHAPAIDDAYASFRSSITPQYDDDGNLTGVEYDGGLHEDIAVAAKAFVASKPYYADAPPGGPGTRASNSRASGKSFSEFSDRELAAIAAEQDPRRR